MPFTIEIDDRDFDVENIRNAVKLPVERGYSAELTIDEPAHGEGVFFGDVALLSLDGDTLTVAEWGDDGPDIDGQRHRFNLSDIRRISFY